MSSMSTGVGLDFGTSNSAMGYMRSGRVQLTTFHQKLQLPSAIFFDEELDEVAFGQDALERYIDGTQGRIMWSPKNALGTNLMREKTLIFGQMVSFDSIIKRVIGHIKLNCEKEANSGSIRSVVCGRPVAFSDTDEGLDQEAQAIMHKTLSALGFEHIEFEYEPIGAAIAYEQNIDREQLALVVDMGGGTSDFTIIRLSPHGIKKSDRKKDILSIGGVHIAGTTFDMRLSLKSVMPELGLGSTYRSMLGKEILIPTQVFHLLSTLHKINFAYTPRSISFVEDVCFGSCAKEKTSRLMDVLDLRYGHALAKHVEGAKIALSTTQDTTLSTKGLEHDFDVQITRQTFEDSIKQETSDIQATMRRTIQDSGVNASDIDVVFMTGGSSQVPIIRSCVTNTLPESEIITGDMFGSVSTGLTLLAAQRFGS